MTRRRVPSILALTLLASLPACPRPKGPDTPDDGAEEPDDGPSDPGRGETGEPAQTDGGESTEGGSTTGQTPKPEPK